MQTTTVEPTGRQAAATVRARQTQIELDKRLWLSSFHAPLRPLHDPDEPPRDGRCLWWTLPAELRDMIFAHLFSNQTVGVACPLPLPTATTTGGHPLDTLMVSKQYFAESCMAFFQHTSFRLNSNTGTMRFLRAPPGLVPHIRTMTIDLSTNSWLSAEKLVRALPRLRDLRLTGFRSNMVCLTGMGRGRCSYAEVLEHLEDMIMLQQLRQSKSLRSLEIEVLRCTNCNKDVSDRRCAAEEFGRGAVAYVMDEIVERRGCKCGACRGEGASCRAPAWVRERERVELDGRK